MKMKDLCNALSKKKVKTVFVSHDEDLQFEDLIDLQRFAEKLRKEGFIPLLAKDFRPHGRERVSEAIGKSDLTLVLAFSEETMKRAKAQGLTFVQISDFKRLIEKL